MKLLISLVFASPIAWLSWTFGKLTWATWELFHNVNPDSVIGLMTLGSGFVALISALSTFVLIAQGFMKRPVLVDHVVIEENRDK